ncbi:MAG: hypothetical protein AMS27_04755 [Bacteroides sp. SM23_62_1]|nr:MAG: hypothetical protein AMS27_04755 [Bacteroides sp. SM23_62_1]
MKKQQKLHSFIYILILTAFILPGCQDRIYETYELNNPVYLTYDELREAVSDTLPINLEHPGKIYIRGDMLFVNEVRKGIHIIDNSDPASPQVLKFIEIPGNIDLAVKGNVLYADSYIDLVVIDISDLSDINEIGRIEDVFSYSIPPYESQQRVGEIDQSLGVVVGWKTETVTEEISEPFLHSFTVRGWEATTMNNAFYGAKSGGGNNSAGTGGSMARFIIYENILYTIDISTLHFFDVSESTTPWAVGNQSIGWNIETVFIAKDHLFIGAQTGMYIYSLYDPVKPQYISTYWHRTSCDPVVVEGNYAYVTLRTGTLCEQDVNQLDVVDIRDLDNPEKIKSYTMYNPHGLGIDNGILFVCDGEEGLKVYNASDPYNIKANKLAHFPDINAFDVIPIDDLLIMVGKDGIYQYDYTNLENIELLSTLPIFSD